jgi:hypothetical protein
MKRLLIYLDLPLKILCLTNVIITCGDYPVYTFVEL